MKVVESVSCSEGLTDSNSVRCMITETGGAESVAIASAHAGGSSVLDGFFLELEDGTTHVIPITVSSAEPTLVSSM